MPAAVPAGRRRDAQLLLRLTKDQLDWLDAAAYLHRSTANAYVYGLLAAHIGTLQQSESVATAYELRRAHDSAQADVTPLERPQERSDRRNESG